MLNFYNQDIGAIMSIKLKTIVKNNFWILEENGHKVGTVNKEGKNYVVYKIQLMYVSDFTSHIQHHVYF